MKRYGDLWDRLVSWSNLVSAARKARRRKRGRHVVQRFEFNQEFELLRLWRELEDDLYRPDEFHSHWIHYPKQRMISAASYHDRVVHHALMNVLEPILERHFHDHSYACRKGKGTHAAANRLQQLMGRYRYAVKCDVRKYFPSIDHAILKELFRRLIKDRKVLSLMDMIVDYSNRQEQVLDWYSGDSLFTPLERPRGLPIGNLTSQWFANWMLNDLDHYITKKVGIGGYVRYCDDFVLLHHDRSRLACALELIVDQLASKRLSIHEKRLSIVPVRSGLTFLGYRIWPGYRILKKDNIRRFRRRLAWMRRAYGAGIIGWPEVKQRLDSWLGHARQANSERLIRRLSRDWVFQRDCR